MNGEIQLDKINNKKKINALKKVKNVFRLKLFIFVITVIIINIVSLYLWNNYRIVTDEKGEKTIERVTFNSKYINNQTNVIIKTKQRVDENTIDGYIYQTIILTINENGKCINTREKREGYTKEGIQVEYSKLKEIEDVADVYSNVEIIDNSIYYNDNTRNNLLRDKIIDDIKVSTELQSVEEY